MIDSLMHWRSVARGKETAHKRGSSTMRRGFMGAGRSLLMSPLTTWHRQMGASVTSDLRPSQQALEGACGTPVLVRKSAHGISPDSDV